MIKLREESVILELKARNKEGSLNELAELLHGQCPTVDLATVCRLLEERELVGSTGVGNGVAIPHAKVKQLDHILLSLGRSQEGIQFDSIDNQPVHIIILILSPADRPDDYLKTLAKVSRFLKNPEMRRQLKQATSTNKIVELFNNSV